MPKVKTARKPAAEAKATAGTAPSPVKTRPAKARAPKKTKPTRKVASRKMPDLADAGVRAELKRRNLERLEDKAPGLYWVIQNHQPLSKLVVDEDGQPDVVFEGEYFYNKRHDAYVAEQLEGFWKNPQRMRLAPMQPQHFDDVAGPFIHRILERGLQGGIDFHVGHTSDESYFLYIMGLGLGGHIAELVERTNCRALAIVDPSPEFLVHSLEVFDWCKLFDTFDDREGLISVFMGNNPMTLSHEIRQWLRGINPIGVDGSTCFVHYNNPVFNTALKRLIEDRDLILSGLGFFYDETLMIKNTHHNLFSGKERVYVRPQNPRLEAPVFVIGNGPSLDNDLDFIRENQDKAIIVSSGSSLRPLVLSGINVDFQIETENVDVYPLIAQVAEDHDISSVCLVTSTTVDIDVPPFFDDVLYYFRGSLSPYPIFANSDRRILLNPNPTVVNASLSFAQELGFRRFYFFGTDLGTTMGPEKHHSKHAYQYTEGAILRPQVFTIPVAANFGGTCMTSDGLYWTRDAAEKAIRQFSRGLTYFNCSEGAKIEGAIPLPSKLIELPDLPDGKQPVIDEIFECFPVYGRKEFDDHWDDEKMLGYFNDWLDEFVDLAIDQPNYDDLGYLSKIMEHLHPKQSLDVEDWGSALVFRGTLFQVLMAFEYYLRRLSKKDVRKFEKIAREEMAKSIDYLRKTATEEFGTLSKDAAGRTKAKSA